MGRLLRTWYADAFSGGGQPGSTVDVVGNESELGSKFEKRNVPQFCIYSHVMEFVSHSGKAVMSGTLRIRGGR